MAINVTKVAATPHMVRYQVTGDADDNTTKSAAALIADCAEGPLKQYLSMINNKAVDADWSAIGLSDPAVSVVGGGYSASGAIPACVAAAGFFGTGGSRSLYFAVARSGSIGAILEIRYNHSLVR